MANNKDKAQTELCQAVRAKIAPAEKGGLPAELVSEYCKVYGVDIGDASMKMFTKDVTICNTACYIITPKNATRCVLLVHGYFDHAAAWRKLVPRLLKDNCMLILYDLKGHGFSDGDRADIADFKEYLEQMRAIVDFASEFGMPLHAVAHSTGAGILADLLLHDKEHATKLSSCVLMAPLLHSNHWGISRFGRNILRGDVKSVKRSFKKNSSDKSFKDFQKADPLQSDMIPLSWTDANYKWAECMLSSTESYKGANVLFIQGTKDTVVEWKFNMKHYKELFPNATFSMLEGARHQLMNESQPFLDTLSEKTLEWLKNGHDRMDRDLI